MPGAEARRLRSTRRCAVAGRRSSLSATSVPAPGAGSGRAARIDRPPGHAHRDRRPPRGTLPSSSPSRTGAPARSACRRRRQRPGRRCLACRARRPSRSTRAVRLSQARGESDAPNVPSSLASTTASARRRLRRPFAAGMLIDATATLPPPHAAAARAPHSPQSPQSAQHRRRSPAGPPSSSPLRSYRRTPYTSVPRSVPIPHRPAYFHPYRITSSIHFSGQSVSTPEARPPDFRTEPVALSVTPATPRVIMPTVLFEQYVEEGLGCASYLIGDEQAGEAIVVDPAYAVEPVPRHGRAQGRPHHARPRDAHARRPRLRARPARARARAPRRDPPRRPSRRIPFEPLEDGTEVEVGQVSLRVIHTPGHRPEHCCFAVIDRSRAPEPWLVLTGDSLLVGDAARPDLAVEATRRRGGPLPQPAPPARAAGRRRAVPRPRRRIALRRRDELQGLVHDRLRAPLQPLARP